MNKGDALDRIVQMSKIAERTNNEGEKANALSMIERLQAQFRLTDREIKRAMDIEEAGGVDATGPLGGNKLWYYERRIAPTVDTIKDEIAFVLARIKTQDDTNRLALLCEFYDDLRALVDRDAKDAWSGKLNVGRVRSEAIAAAYKEERDKVSVEPYWHEDAPLKIHQRTLDAVKGRAGYKANLTTSTIESAVRIYTKKLEQDYWKAMQEDA